MRRSFERSDEIEYLPSLSLGKRADFVIDLVGCAYMVKVYGQ
jgi:hypothetical protein